MTSPSRAGRYRIGEHVVEIRAPRLADAEAWRRTTLQHESRLSRAFGGPDADWDEEHSLTAWASTWWSATHDPDVRIARVLTLADGDEDRIVGYQAWAGRDPRTGQAEASTWVAGLPRSAEVTAFLTATCVLEMFEAHPDLRFVVAPMAVHNRPSIALSESVGFHHLQTLRGLREYDGVATDHVIHVRENTAEDRAELRAFLDTIGAETLRPRPAARPSVGAVGGLGRYGVRRLRARARSLRAPAARDDRTVTVGGRRIGSIGVHVDGGSSTTEVIDRLSPDADPTAGVAEIVAACRAAAEAQETRRLTIALADRHAAAVTDLTALGFVSEGRTLPTLGDEATPRESWTRIQER